MANFVTDTFTGSNGTILSSHTGELGATWSIATGSGDAVIDTNRIYVNTADCIYKASGTPPGVEYSVQCSFRRLSTVAGQNLAIGGRIDGSNAGYMLYITNATVSLLLRNGFTDLGTVSQTWTNNQDYTLRLEIKDATKKVFLDGVQIISNTDNTITAAGSVAIEVIGAASSSTGFVMNDFSAFPNPAGPTAGTVSPVCTSNTTATVSATACSGGTAPFSYQYQRAPDSSGSPGTYANVGSAVTGVSAGVAPTSLSDTGLTTGNIYWYRYIVTDNATLTSTSAGVAVTIRVAGIYFVSAAGNDSNNGITTSTPWLTITKVNSFGLTPGDSILFNGGDTFAGNLLVNPSVQPSAALPIIVSSYGTGNAIISCSNSYGIKVLDAGYVKINNITVTGSGVTVSGTYPTKTSTCTSTQPGVLCEVSTVSTYRSGIVIDNVTVSGCLTGIQTHSSNNTSTAVYDGLQISNCTIFNCGFSGISVWGTNPTVGSGVAAPSNRFIRILDCNVYNIVGQSAVSAYGTGFGIILFNSADSVVDRCRTKNIAEACNNTVSNGPTGIIGSQDTRCVFRRCEASLVWAPSTIDGCAFDLDGACNNCTIEYCYAHDCVGAGFFLWHGSIGTHSGSVLRYNISQNCGTINSSNAGAAFATVGSTGSPVLYQNTFYNLKPTGGISALINSDRTCTYYNNIFAIEGSMTFGISGGSSSVLAGNVYNVRTGASFSINLGSTYTSLAAMQAASYEVSNGNNVGVSGDPLFISAGGGGDQLPSQPVARLSAYNLGTGSPARSAGVSLLRLSITPQAEDWHGRDAVSGESATLSGIDAGAVRYGSTAFGEGINGSSILGML